MNTIGRVDQAIILLKERLRKLGENKAGQAGTAASARQAEGAGALDPIRQLVQKGQIGEEDLRRALVRTLLADALGEELVGSIAFQSVADQVARIIEDSEGGRELMARAMAELR